MGLDPSQAGKEAEAPAVESVGLTVNNLVEFLIAWGMGVPLLDPRCSPLC